MYGDIEKILEELSLELVLADIEEPESFLSLIPLFKNVHETAKKNGITEIVQEASRAAKLIKRITRKKQKDPSTISDSITDIVTQMKFLLEYGKEQQQNLDNGTDNLNQLIDNNLLSQEGPNEEQKIPIQKLDDKKEYFHPGKLPRHLDMDDFSQFLSVQGEVLDKLEVLILNFEKGDTKGTINEIKRLIHTMKGESGFLSLTEVEKVCHRIEDLLIENMPVSFAEVLLRAKDWLFEVFKIYSGEKGHPQNSKEILNLLDQYEKKEIQLTDEQQKISLENKLKEQTPQIPSQQDSQIAEIKESISIDANRLDRLIDIIGELAIAEAMVSQSLEAKTDISKEFQASIKMLSKTTKELQDMGLRLRMVPLKTLFNRMRRVARDVAKKGEKRVKFLIKGEATELDKKLVDGLSDPLIHLVRNSIDHGIEPDLKKRIDARKPEQATVTLEAYHKGGNLCIEVRDDGRGINREKLLKRARDDSLIEPDAQLEDDEILNLVFCSGLSTADQVTDVSGRGVGMDVVYESITAFNGKIKIESQEGVGTTFRIMLPLTLSIMDGMIVGVGDQKFVIPTLSVVTSLRPSPEAVSTAFNSMEMLMVHDSLVPLFRLHELFNIPGSIKDPCKAIAVVVENSGFKATIMVDELLSKQSIVRKSLNAGMQNVPGISGGTIMPDGRVCLILDIGEIVQMANKNR
ncbi:MAG: hypothetical protein GY729_06180 [Desulfobacteraceae bacterium]|nr:hypothetical protein [Desulfobacteraceae bacterium]